MGLALKRIDLQHLAEAKLSDAELLFENGRYSNAYYLAGYAIEIGLKACISRRILGDTLPDKNFVTKIHQHNLKELVGLAGLQGELRNQENLDQAFAANWGIVAEWTPECRYETIDKFSAQLLLQAVNHDVSGVLPWIKLRW
jgi:HEPN domain-containing protein